MAVIAGPANAAVIAVPRHVSFSVSSKALNNDIVFLHFLRWYHEKN
jgi:hypothetical protein